MDTSLSICSIFYIDSCSHCPSPQVNDTGGTKDDKNCDGVGGAEVWETLCPCVLSTCLVHSRALIMLFLLSVIYHILLRGQVISSSEKRSLTGNKSLVITQLLECPSICFIVKIRKGNRIS